MHRSFEGIAFHAAVVTDVAAPAGSRSKSCCKSAGRRRSSVTRSCRAAWWSSTPMTPTRRSWGASTSMHVESPSLSSRRSAREEPLTLRHSFERIDGSGTRHVAPRLQPRVGRASCRLVGPRVATCALAAAALAWAMEIDEADVIAGLESVQTSPDTLRRLSRARISMFASTPRKRPDDVAEALAALRAVAAGRVHLVMSAEGSGDQARTPSARRGRRKWRRSRDPDAEQPTNRRSQPDSRRSSGWFPPPGQGSRRARPTTRHRVRPGPCPDRLMSC